jgi:hypothetical protein
MCIAIAHQHLNERNEWVWNCHGVVIGMVFFGALEIGGGWLHTVGA